jgi:periplasmic copper chaperone A
MARKFPRSLSLVIAAALLCVGLACTVPATEPLTIANAWVRSPAPGQKVAGAYMELKSDATATLVGVSSPAAARAELHSMVLDAGVMKMRPVENIALPPGKAVKLAPGGLHIMLLDLKRPLKEGDKVPLTLFIRHAGATIEVRVEATVKAAAAMPQHSH